MFLQNVATAAHQVAVLYIIVAVGFICDKAKLYTEKAAKLTNDLLFYIVTPAIIINSFSSMDFTAENWHNLLMSFLGGTVFHLIAIIISLPFFRHGNEDSDRVYRFACVFGNVGYMVLPLAQAVLGNEGVFFCSGVLIPFNVLSFTYGLSLMKKTQEGKSVINPKSLILNPGVISVIIGLPIYLLEISLPDVVMQPVQYISSLNTPLAMLMFGTYLSQTDLKKMFFRPQAYLVALLKLIVMPLISLAVFRLMGLSGTLLSALILSASAPTANNTVMFSTKYGRDNEAASQTVAVVSFISIITMPVMIALSQIF